MSIEEPGSSPKFWMVAVMWVVAVPLDAVAISLCWNWFVVPAVHLPTIGIVAAIGVRIFLAAISRQRFPEELLARYAAMSGVEKLWKASENLIFGPLVAIAMGFVWHLVAG